MILFTKSKYEPLANLPQPDEPVALLVFAERACRWIFWPDAANSAIWTHLWRWTGSPPLRGPQWPRARLRDEPHHLLHRHHQNAEHQMAEHLWRPAHTHVVAAAVVLQVTVDALARAALVVPDPLGQLVAGPPFGAGLGAALPPRRGLASMIGTCPSARLLSQISGAS